MTRPAARASTEQLEQYVVAVAGWDLSWIFALGDPTRDPDPYREHLNLVLQGDVHHPENFRLPRAEVTLSARAKLPDPWDGPRPKSLGYLEGRKGLLRAYILIPTERLALLVPAAARLRLVALVGDRLFRGNGLVRSLHVDTHYAPEEW